MTAAEAQAVIGRYDPGHFFRYAGLTELLQALAALYPDRCRLESVGRSPAGRRIWSVTLTRFATGPDIDKPAYHICADHHAGEVTGSAVALYTVKYLCDQYGRDPLVTELLDTRTVYVLPRLTVDGSEDYFDRPALLRSSPLQYPEPELPAGWYADDLDGDGRIRLLRVRDDALGEWKRSGRDPRLMERRRPDDREGPFYRVLHEGLYQEPAPGGGLACAPPDLPGPDRPLPGRLTWPHGLDFNRNYPLHWQPEHRQPGAGHYPLDRPEVRALAAFFADHPNICGALSYHTYGGVLLRPSPLEPDERLDAADLRAFRALGEIGRELTGYPCVSVYHDFTRDYDPQKLDVGSWLEWVYDGLGILGYEVELWDWPYIAGVPKRPLREQREWGEAERLEYALRMLAWNDRELQGRGFQPWTPHQHPQLGAAEVGGWDPKWVVQNPPAHLLPDECHRHCLFSICHALASPLLAVGEAVTEPLGGDTYRVAVRVENRGALPTYVTRAAHRLQRSGPVTVELNLDGGARSVAGRNPRSVGDLEGYLNAELSAWGSTPAENAGWVEWVVQASPGTVLTVTARHPRAGRAVREVVLP